VGFRASNPVSVTSPTRRIHFEVRFLRRSSFQACPSVQHPFPPHTESPLKVPRLPFLEFFPFPMSARINLQPRPLPPTHPPSLSCHQLVHARPPILPRNDKRLFPLYFEALCSFFFRAFLQRCAPFIEMGPSVESSPYI